MKRLISSRPARTAVGREHVRNNVEAVTVLAHLARERHRLRQEHTTLTRRIHNIDARLTAIAASEIKLIPMIGLNPDATPPPALVAPSSLPTPSRASTGVRVAPARSSALGAVHGEMTLQY